MQAEVVTNNFTNQHSVFAPGPDAYPWGYPLLLLPAYSAVGNHPLAFKTLNLLFLGIGLFFFSLMVRKRTDSWFSWVVVGSFSFLPAILIQNDTISSDICFFGLVLCVFFLFESDQPVSYKNSFFIGTLIFIATFIRTVGVVLFVPYILLVVTNWKIQKDKWSLFAVPLAFISLFTLQALVLPQGSTSYFGHFELFSPQRLLENFVYYLSLPLAAFDQIPLAWFWFGLIVVCFLVGIATTWKNEKIILSFMLALLSVYIVWPERQGLRFILPILPLLWIFALRGINWIKERLLPIYFNIVIAFFTLLCIIGFSMSLTAAVHNINNGRSINGPYDDVSQELFRQVKETTQTSDIFVFFKPRAFRLFTERVAFAASNCADLTQANYVVISLKQESVLQPSEQSLASCAPTQSFKEVFRNKRFIMLRRAVLP